LEEALTVFSSNGPSAIKTVSQTDDPSEYWRPLAKSCTTVAPLYQNEVRARYYSWAADFYQLLLDSWRGPKLSLEYRECVLEYCYALEQSGQKAKAEEARAAYHIMRPRRTESTARGFDEISGNRRRARRF
jgi:hypothetical protein